MDKSRISFLYQQYLKKTKDPQEIAEFKAVLNDATFDEIISELLDDSWNQINDEELENVQVPHEQEILQNIKSQPRKQAIRKSIWPKMIAVAAAVSLIVAAGLYFYQLDSRTKTEQTTIAANDIAPGKNKATLTLANGKKIVLSDVGKGELATESGVLIRKTADGKLIYEIKDQSEAITNSLNTISTANGESYQVLLPDGSLVILNAASSLTYSTALNRQPSRKVELKGEAYFEVAKDKKHPFIIHTSEQTVEVLGTHFNINAYTDEPDTKTTLIEGSVKITGNKAQAVIKPGEQASFKNNKIKVSEVNVNAVIDWKDGKFRFKNEALPSILRKISRWYDVKIIYLNAEAVLPTFTGSVSRFDHVSKVLNMLEETSDVKFIIEGKTIKVK
ncbi:FecR family protein [Pedobacter caeni]|uniref:FecR family protein n=1 Tax=Pedobacter caeni TaxID=288992 RepID=A0A1M5J298_9SPHI|nr:FecR domain-containing protein [Pedobacter caeni]SHG34727.1 FecR family protein [Pedobacter caeni]